MKQPVVRLKIRVCLPDGSTPYLDPVPPGTYMLTVNATAGSVTATQALTLTVQ